MAGRRENLTPWPKGVSGNRNGRPRRTALTDALLEELEKRCPSDKAHRSNLELIAAKLVTLARRGNMQAIREILDRVEGKAIPRNQLADAGNPPLTIHFFDAVQERLEELRRKKKEREQRLLSGESAPNARPGLMSQF